MSLWWVLKRYASWRETYLEEHPEKRLIPTTEEPFIKLSPTAVTGIADVKKKGLVVVVLAALILASMSE